MIQLTKAAMANRVSGLVMRFIVAAFVFSSSAAMADDAACDGAARFWREQGHLLEALRATPPAHATWRDEPGMESSRFAEARYFARCLASAAASGADTSQYIESLRAIGADDK